MPRSDLLPLPTPYPRAVSDRPGVFLLQVLVLLAAATIIGLLARLILRGRSRLSTPATVLTGVVGIAVAGAVSSVIFDNPGTGGWKVLLTAVAATAGLLLLAAAVTARLSPTARLPLISEQIAAGESDSVEFKSAARWNWHTGQRDPAIEQVIAKTVAAFLNAGGGTLLIGIADSGKPVGLERDYSLVKSPDRDRYELWLRDLLRSSLGAVAAAAVRIDFAGIEGHEVCRLTMPRGPSPTYVRAGKGGADVQFWLRTGNSTRQLSVEETVTFARHRWPTSIGEAVRGQWRTATSS